MRMRTAALAVALLAAMLTATVHGQEAQAPLTPKSDAELAAVFDRPLEGLETPPQKDVYVYRSELTPAIVIRTRLSSVRLFDQMRAFGLDGPTHVAYVAGGQVRTAGRGQIAGPLDEGWLLVWFAGGQGWDRIRHSAYAQNNVKDDRTYAFDVPFLVSLQNKPSGIAVGEDGLEITFAGEAGVVQYLPLLGVNRPQPSVTQAWAGGLPEGIAALCRGWQGRLRQIPVQVTESYTVDAAQDAVTLVHEFRFVEVPDQWGTPGSADSPIPPAIALAEAHGFPVLFDGKPVDTQSPSYFGPLWVVPGTNRVAMQVRGTMNLITQMQVPNVQPGQDAELLAKIDAALRGSLGDTGMGWWAAAGAAMRQGGKAELIPYAQPATAVQAQAATMRLMHENVFGGEKTTHRILDEQRGRTYLVDYVNHFQRYAGDDESPASEIVRGTFSYAFYTGDWQTPIDRWADLQAAGVGSYVKNNWVLQSRPNSGGDTYHDVIVGTAHMARMAAVLGREQDFGLFSYLFARHLLAYYGFEYALLRHARQYEPWFITLTDEEMLVWDIYEPFGGMFTPYSKEGYYGPYSGFYEHYYRMDDDIMPRFYRAFLPEHMKRIMDEMVSQHVPDPQPNEGSKWALLFQFRAAFLQQDAEALEAWLAEAAWQGKDNAEVYAALYDARHPRQTVDLLNPSLRRPVSGSGIHFQGNGIRHFSLDLDTQTLREPAIYWFGFNAPDAQLKGAHGGNAFTLGAISVGGGKPVAREGTEPNWVTSVFSYNVSSASPEQQAAAEQQGKADWMVIGPFGEAEDNSSDWSIAYPPEQAVDLAATHEGLVRRKDDDGGKAGTRIEARWQPRQMGTGNENGKPVAPYHMPARWGFNQFGCTYAYTRVFAPQAMPVRVGISSHGGQKVWINGQIAYENTRDPRTLREDERIFDAQLGQGWNDVLVRVRNVEFWQQLYFRIYDADEQPIVGLRFDPQGR